MSATWHCDKQDTTVDKVIFNRNSPYNCFKPDEEEK